MQDATTSKQDALYDHKIRAGLVMAIQKRTIITIIVTLLISYNAYASFFDNRFFPPFERPYVTVDCRPSHAAFDIFASTSKTAYGINGNEIGIPQLQGVLDQAEWARSFVTAGFANPLPAEWQLAELPWTMQGKIQAQGIVPSYQQQITSWFSVGFYGLLMRVQSRFEFFLAKETNIVLTQSDKYELEEIRRSMSESIGLKSDHWHLIGLGDLDLYARLNRTWYYFLKMRRIDAGIRFGLLAPIGNAINYCYSSSIPFGGNRHWGTYVMGDAEFEVKEDWKVGAWLRLSKRFTRIQEARMPVGKEPQFLGLVVGRALVDPGYTVSFMPYFSLENLREGLGVRVLYTITHHEPDYWADARNDKFVPVNLEDVKKRSSWTSEYVTIMIFYDFGKTKIERGFSPIVRFAWDVPQVLIASRDVPKVHKVSLGVEFNF